MKTWQIDYTHIIHEGDKDDPSIEATCNCPIPGENIQDALETAKAVVPEGAVIFSIMELADDEEAA